MTLARLPAPLRPVRSDALIRLGRDNDGGYLVDGRDVAASDCLLGLGVNDDWSFEERFTAINDVPVVAYDGSIGLRRFQKDVIKSLPRLDNPRLLARRLGTLRGYRAFFRGRRRHVPAFVGLDRPPTHVGVKAVLDGVAEIGCRRPFLKVDIDGYEYRVLDEIAARSAMLTGLVIEFHDCDLHMARIVDFVGRVGLQLVHAHANNHAPLSDDGVPLVVELSFSSSPPAGGAAELPHPLDRPCDPARDEIVLTFG